MSLIESDRKKFVRTFENFHPVNLVLMKPTIFFFIFSSKNEGLFHFGGKYFKSFKVCKFGVIHFGIILNMFWCNMLWHNTIWHNTLGCNMFLV